MRNAYKKGEEGGNKFQFTGMQPQKNQPKHTQNTPKKQMAKIPAEKAKEGGRPNNVGEPKRGWYMG